MTRPRHPSLCSRFADPLRFGYTVYSRDLPTARHLRCNSSMQSVLFIIALLLGVLAGCTANTTKPTPAPAAAPASAPASGATPVPGPAASAPAPVRTTLAAEQRRLSELFRGTPVVFSMQADGSLRVEVPLGFCFDRGAFVV